MNKDYSEYLECLGFDERGYISESEKASVLDAPQITPNITPWLFVLDQETQNRPEALNLFRKMLEALKLSQNEFQSTFAKSPEDVTEIQKKYLGYRVCVIMGSKLHSNEGRTDLCTTFSPAECLISPDLKRPVWNSLQEAQKTLLQN